MTREETIQVLSLLKAAYPNSYKGMTAQEANGVISVWATQFSDTPVEIVLVAINKLIASKAFPPAISEVKEKVKALYYEATSELLTSDNLNNADKQRLLQIQQCCQSISFCEEPSLLEIIQSEKAMLTSARCAEEGRKHP